MQLIILTIVWSNSLFGCFCYEDIRTADPAFGCIMRDVKDMATWDRLMGCEGHDHMGQVDGM